jgi:hypothetical protein
LNKQKQEEEKSPVKKFLSQSLDLSYNYTYAKPADVGPQIPVEPSPTLGDRAEQLGRGIQSTLTQAGGFIGGTVVDPIANAIEFAESRLVGREPQYRSRFQEAQEVSQNIRQELGELDTAGEIAFGLGSVAGMVPEMLTGSLPLRGARTAADLLPQGARSMSEVLGREADQAAAASALLAPRFGSQTAYEAEQSGASPLQAGLAGAVETVATPFTNVLPVSRVGGLASRIGTGAVSGVAAEAGVEGVVSPFLPDELRQQRSLTNPENFTTAAGAGSTLAAIFGSRRLPNTFSQAEIEALAADPVLRSGAEAGANQTARTDAEAQALAEQATRMRDRPAQPRVQETMDLEVEPTITDMFSGQTTPAVDPETRRAQEPDRRSERLDREAGFVRGEMEAQRARQAEEDYTFRLNTLREQLAAPETQTNTMRRQLIEQQIAQLESRGPAVPAPLTSVNPSAEPARLPATEIRAEDVRRLEQEATQTSAELSSVRNRIAEIEAAPAGARGGFSRSQNSELKRLRTDAARLELGLSDNQRIRQEADAQRIIGERGPAEVSPDQGVLPLRQQAGQPAPLSPPQGLNAEGQLDLRIPQEVVPTRQERVQQPTQATPTQPATTPQPTTRAARAEAARAVEERPVVREDVVDAEGVPQGEQVVEPAVSPRDAERQAIEREFFPTEGNPREARDLNSPEDVAAASATRPEVIPAEQRKQTVIERDFANVTNAAEAIDILSAKTPPNSPMARVIDILKKSPFMKDTAFQIVQPESDAASHPKLQKPNTRGILRRTSDGKNTVLVKGSGFKLNGVNSAETLLHEIVHAGSYDLVRGVKAKRITDPQAVKAVEDLEKLRESMNESIQNDPSVRETIGPEAASRVDYAGKDVDEFLAVSLTSAPFQAAMKLVNKWKPLLNTIRNLWGMPRSATEALNKILDAGLSVIEQQTRLESDVRRSRVQEERAAVENNRQQRAEPANEQAETTPQRNLRQEAGIAQTKQTKRETWGTAGVTSLEGLKNLAGVSKNALSDIYYKMLTSTEGVDARVKLAEELATGTKQEYDLVVDGFMNQVKSLVNYGQLNDKDAKSVRNRMMNYLRGNTDALSEVAGQESRAVRRVLGNPKLRQALDKVRGEIDGLTKRIGQEIVRAYEGKEMPESQLEKLKTLKNGLGIYMSRVYEAYIDKNYAPDLLNRYEKGDATAKAVLDPLVDRLTDQVSQLGDLLDTARGIAAAENAALAEGGRKETKKPWTRENWEKVSDIPLERMYRDLIGNPNIAREQMFRELEGWFANNVGEAGDAKTQKDKSRKAALQVAKDILLATQQTNQLSTYWRNLRGDDRALRDLKDVPSDVRQALGEIVDPVMRAAFTISRQSAALASLRENNLLFDDMPQLFRTQDQRESGIHDYQVPNNPQAYGKLAGRYTDKLTHDMIVAKNEMFGPTGSFIEFQQTLTDTKGIPAKGGVVAKGALTGATKLSGIQKTAAIIMNTGNFLMDAMGNASFVLMNGNFDPKTWKEGMAIGAELVGTTFRKQYSAEARRMMRLGVIDPTLTQVDEQVRQAMRETEITTKLRQTSAPVDFARQAKKSVGTGIDLIRDSRALLENVPKIANFLNTEKQLAKAFPNLSKAEIERMSAENVKNTNINYSRVHIAATLLETSLISYVASFMSESLRVGVTNVREGIREVRSPNPTIREMGAKRLAGSVMSGAVMTMAINALMDSFGAEELDDDWKLLMNKLGFHEQGQNRKIMDVADDLTVISVDAGRVEGMDVFNMQLRTAAQILQFAAEGETESAIETAKEGFGTLVGLFSGGAPLGKAIVNTATGRQSSNFIQREFPEWYGDTVAGLGEVVGDAAAVRVMESLGSVFDLGAPGAAKQYLRGLASSDIERNPALARAQMLGMPVAFDNPIRTLKGGPVRTYITARNDASDSLEPIVALFTEKETPKLIESAVSNYINTQREAYTELAKYVDVAKAAGRLAGKSDGEIRDMILEALRSNNGLNREDAVRLADQEPFRPRAPGNEKQFLQGAIDRAVLRVPTDTEAGRLRQERMREVMDERRRQIIEQIRQRVAEYD